MIRRIVSILIALLSIVVSANAQSLFFEVQANEAKISLAGATEMTALQFSMKLPKGITINTGSATLGSATDGHTLCIETLDNGDLLFVLYSMDFNTFMDGELLRLPINGMQEGDASLYTIRYANADAVSRLAEDVVTGVQSPSISPKGKGLIYNVSGQMVNGKLSNGKFPQGVNIKDGKKILVK